MDRRAALYRTIWRWHFYAGLFVIPFVLILSITGAIYLFKPQLDRWEERGYHGTAYSPAASANAQLEIVLSTYPMAKFDSYRLPERTGDAAMIHIGLPDGTMRDVYISARGRIIGSVDPESRISAIVQSIHRDLMAGRPGALLVELVASWAIVMILTGLYLWWPRGSGLAGIVWPRQRAFLRDCHAVTAFWISGLALILLLTALPWASVWGDAFRWVRAEAGWLHGKQDWQISGQHLEHDHAAMLRMEASGAPLTALSDIVAKAEHEHLAFPVLVKPPGKEMVWTVKSEAQNRTLRATITYDMASGAKLSRERFADRHPIDQLVGYGIAWHEGQLFGWVNQLIGLLTALSLITLTVTGFLMWRRRKPDGSLGAPPLPATPGRIGGGVVIVLALAAVLPMLAGSLMMIWIFEVAIRRLWPGGSAWLGLSR